MTSLTASTANNEFAALPLGADYMECVEASANRKRGGRGIVTGVLLGASFWGAILTFLGVIKF